MKAKKKPSKLIQDSGTWRPIKKQKVDQGLGCSYCGIPAAFINRVTTGNGNKKRCFCD